MVALPYLSRAAAATVVILASVPSAAPLPSEAEFGCAPTWNVVPTPNLGSGHNALASIAVVSSNDVWAVGDAENGTNRKTLTEHWNGSSWTLVPSPNSPNPINYLTGVTGTAANDVWAAGYSSKGANRPSFTLIEHWNGSNWIGIPSPNAPLRGPYEPSNELYDVDAFSANDVWAVGRTYDFSVGQALIEHWNGSNWSIVRSPDLGPFNHAVLYGVAAVAANDVWAVGTYYVDGVQSSLIEHWNGRRWRVVPSPNVGTFHNSFLGIHATSADDIWAVGYHQTVEIPQAYQTSVLHWDGSTWRVVPSPNENSLNNYLFDVAAASADDAWAVGFYDTGSSLLTMAQHWDGSGWTLTTSPNANSSINELVGVAVASPTDVWAIGQTFDGFAFRTFAQHYACQP
jgi:hypothetical protein